MPFHGFTDWQDCIDHVSATADDPEAICGKLKAEAGAKSLTLEQVEDLCPSCASVMKARGILAIRGDAIKTLFEKIERPVLKVDEEQQTVFGWASVAMLEEGQPVVDLQNDTIDPATLEKAAYDYVRRYRVVNDMHRGPAVGDLIESFVVTPDKLKAMGLKRAGAPAAGLWVGYKLDADEWAAFKRGERPMFSIEGEAQHAEA